MPCGRRNRTDDVDGLLVERGGSAREVGLANHAFTIGGVHDHEIVRRHRSQADGVRGIGLVGPVPLAVGVMNEAFLRQHTEHLLNVHAPERLVL
jgi:hypothetical protein